MFGFNSVGLSAVGGSRAGDASDAAAAVPSFTFPDHVPTRKQYELIGNSLNVRVASLLIERLLSTDL